MKRRTFKLPDDTLETILGWSREVFEEELPQNLALPLELAFEEAIVNIVSYAYPDKKGSIDVEVTIEKGKVAQVTLVDSGIPFDPTKQRPKIPDQNVPASEREIGGLGIALIHELMDQIEYERMGNANCLKFSKAI